MRGQKQSRPAAAGRGNLIQKKRRTDLHLEDARGNVRGLRISSSR